MQKIWPTLNFTKEIKIYQADIVNTFSERDAISVCSTYKELFQVSTL